MPPFPLIFGVAVLNYSVSKIYGVSPEFQDTYNLGNSVAARLINLPLRFSSGSEASRDPCLVIALGGIKLYDMFPYLKLFRPL